MTKENLLALIDEAIVIGKEEQQHEKEFPFLFQNAVDMLNDIKQEIIENAPPRQPQTRATSLGLFVVREVELHDVDYALVLAHICKAYNEYHQLPQY